MLSNDLLAPNWKWSSRYGVSKVRKKGGTYMMVKGDTIEYVAGRNTGIHGEWKMDTAGEPHVKLAVLTHHEDEIRRRIKRQLR